jgi:hypothetical protein
MIQSIYEKMMKSDFDVSDRVIRAIRGVMRAVEFNPAISTPGFLACPDHIA